MKELFSIIIAMFLFSNFAFSQNKLLEVDIIPTGDQQYEGIFLNRNSGFLSFVNGTSLAGEFQPRISAQAYSDVSPGLVLVGTPSLINSNSRGILLRGGEFASLSMGNILEVSNFTTSLLTINYNGYLGLGTTNAKAELHLADGDVFIEDINSGVIMKSNNGNCWRYQPDNNGLLIGTAVTCPN